MSTEYGVRGTFIVLCPSCYSQFQCTVHTAQHSTAQHSTAQHSTAQHSNVPPSPDSA
ncbi:hypothetical protein BO82DRAFT_351134 [Aspergillus uvarum CBS 121591]|uniref:Uncharacterized protein n=1 Tax=Aspergillus uvarum CBS 121591 TaxID=1448315 RepID=A0A319D2J0_9EURO|nr:hypothetical protein BO82DRAFT_351134 [Aspergillus uvarum CBS 121591]PYH85283.1 hypothetical protein BO82DRAFT_351134 [Aspergillus uvarum CBS 121591]